MGHLAANLAWACTFLNENRRSPESGRQVSHGPWRSKIRTLAVILIRTWRTGLNVAINYRILKFVKNAHVQNRKLSVRSYGSVSRYISALKLKSLSGYVWGSRNIHVMVGHVMVTSYRVLKVSCFCLLPQIETVVFFPVLINNSNSTMHLCLWVYMPPRPQVLTCWPQILREEVQIWTPSRVPGPELRVKRSRCFRIGTL